MGKVMNVVSVVLSNLGIFVMLGSLVLIPFVIKYEFMSMDIIGLMLLCSLLYTMIVTPENNSDINHQPLK